MFWSVLIRPKIYNSFCLDSGDFGTVSSVSTILDMTVTYIIHVFFVFFPLIFTPWLIDSAISIVRLSFCFVYDEQTLSYCNFDDDLISSQIHLFNLPIRIQENTVGSSKEKGENE